MEKAHPKPSKCIKMCDPIPWNPTADEVGTAAGSRTALQAGVPLGSTREILRASWTPDDCSLRIWKMTENHWKINEQPWGWNSAMGMRPENDGIRGGDSTDWCGDYEIHKLKIPYQPGRRR